MPQLSEQASEAPALPMGPRAATADRARFVAWTLSHLAGECGISVAELDRARPAAAEKGKRLPVGVLAIAAYQAALALSVALGGEEAPHA